MYLCTKHSMVINFEIIWFGLVWLLCFNGISNLDGLFNAEVILVEEQQWYYITHYWEGKEVHAFLKCICPKVNVIVQEERNCTILLEGWIWH